MNTEIPPDFAVDAEPVGDAYVVAAAGELDLGTVGHLRSALAARPPECTRLVLDLSGLTFFDTSGMRLVVETMQELGTAGIRFAILRGGPDVQRLFAITRLEDRLPFFDDLDEAIAAA